MKIASEPLRKVTLNLFDQDVDWLKDRYGYGYTETVRGLIRKHVLEEKRKDD